MEASRSWPNAFGKRHQAAMTWPQHDASPNCNPQQVSAVFSSHKNQNQDFDDSLGLFGSQPIVQIWVWCTAGRGTLPSFFFFSTYIYIILKYVYFTLRRACVTILFVFATFGWFWHVIWTVSGHGGSYCDGDRDGLRRWDWVEPEAIRLPICLCSGCLGGRFPHVFKLW